MATTLLDEGRGFADHVRLKLRAQIHGMEIRERASAIILSRFIQEEAANFSATSSCIHDATLSRRLQLQVRFFTELEFAPRPRGNRHFA